MLSHKFNDALLWATSLHQPQVRKVRQIPYITHLMTVAALVLENDGNEEQAIAALLHDAIEDQGVTVEEITSRFGENVATLVAAVTEFHNQPKPGWLERKNMYLNNLRNSSPEAVLISLADKYHNACSLEQDLFFYGETLWQDFFKSRKDRTKWFYQELIIIYREQGFDDNWLLLELEKTIKRIFETDSGKSL